MDYNKIRDKFRELYKSEPIMIKAPGRINLIGEHTDYNNGFVLPAAINKNVYLAINKNNLNRIRLFAFDINESIDISTNKIKKNESAWANYLLGSYIELIKEEYVLGGFDCVFGGDLPQGAGLSSSAAIECGVISGLSIVFNQDISSILVAELAQRAEHNFVGVKCGIMDQYAVMFGEENKVVKLDCQNLTHEYMPIRLEGYSIVLVNSNVKHNLPSSEYNIRRKECESGVEILQKHFPEITSLRDANLEQLYEHRSEFEENVFDRCEYVIKENNRVIEFSETLKNNDLIKAGSLLFETHQGLKNQYEVSCSEIDLLVESAMNMDFVLGSRMMGGGFGGCTINFVKNNHIGQFEKEINEIYQKETGIAPSFYNIEITNGIELIK